jgi:hypothetical protein
VGLIYLGAALVITGAGIMLVSYHGEGPVVATNMGKILAVLGFIVYMVARIRYRRKKEADSPSPEDGT